MPLSRCCGLRPTAEYGLSGLSEVRIPLKGPPMKRVVSVLSACMVLGSVSLASAQGANDSDVMFPNFFSSGIGRSRGIGLERPIPEEKRFGNMTSLSFAPCALASDTLPSTMQADNTDDALHRRTFQGDSDFG